MDLKDGDIYPKYSFRLNQEDKEWLDRELEALKTKFNAGNEGSFPIVSKNVLLMAALKRGMRFLRENVHSRCIQKNMEVSVEVPRVWAALIDFNRLEPHVGGQFAGPRTETNQGEPSATGVVLEVVPNELIQFTWKEHAWEEAEETVCFFRLSPIAHFGTRIQLVHSGWEIFPGPKVAALKKEYEAQWDGRLRRLAEVLAKS